MQPSQSTANNEDFLPAALEILDSPPSPLGRMLSITIGVFFMTMLLWSWISKVDVVVTGQGKIIPNGYIKTVQPTENGVITKINVVDGQHVSAGDVLIELDPTDTAGNRDNLSEQLENLQLDLAVAVALLQGNPAASFRGPNGASASKVASATHQMMAIYNGYLASLEELDAEETRLRAQLRALDIEAGKIEQTLPVLEGRVASGGTLLSRDSMRQDDRLSLQQSLIEMRASQKSLVQSRIQLEAAITSSHARQQETISEFEGRQRATEREVSSKIHDLLNDVQTAQRRNEYRLLKAPVAGFVDQLSVHTIGGVLNAGQPVLNIVPTGRQQEVEAFVLNKDIGFIHLGNPAEIKLEAFPFTRFGVLKGRVTSISNDAVANQQLGLVYKIRAVITTPAETITTTGITIGAGMNVSVEIITDERRIIDYFIAPLLRYKDEAIREG